METMSQKGELITETFTIHAANEKRELVSSTVNSTFGLN